MRIFIRVSHWAIWSRRLGSLALPFVAVPLWLHRTGVMPTDAFELAEAIGGGFAALAILLAVIACFRIWVTGDRGWDRTVAGAVLGLICLLPAALFALDAWRYPLTAEVDTDPADPPLLLMGVQPAPVGQLATARLAALFPNLKTRNYPLDAGTVFNIAASLVQSRGWQTLRATPPPAGQINALATSLFGFRDEVAIRLTSTAAGETSVAMRAAALTPLHEPGANATTVDGFLADLDTRVAAAQNVAPAGSDEDDTDDSGDDTDQPPVPAPPPPARLGKR